MVFGLHEEIAGFLKFGWWVGWLDNLIVERVDDGWRIGWLTTGFFCCLVEGRIYCNST
jgi:hypothetical protein